MGYLAVRDFIDHASLDQALAWHFEANCWPPIPAAFIAPAKAAIEAVVAGDPTREITLSLSPRLHLETRQAVHVTSEHLVEILHLDAFVDAREEEAEYGLIEEEEDETWT